LARSTIEKDLLDLAIGEHKHERVVVGEVLERDDERVRRVEGARGRDGRRRERGEEGGGLRGDIRGERVSVRVQAGLQEEEGEEERTWERSARRCTSTSASPSGPLGRATATA